MISILSLVPDPWQWPCLERIHFARLGARSKVQAEGSQDRVEVAVSRDPRYERLGHGCAKPWVAGQWPSTNEAFSRALGRAVVLCPAASGKRNRREA